MIIITTTLSTLLASRNQRNRTGNSTSASRIWRLFLVILVISNSGATEISRNNKQILLINNTVLNNTVVKKYGVK